MIPASKPAASGRRSNTVPPIVALTGPDRFRKRHRINAVVRQHAIQLLDRHELSGRTCTAAQLGDLLRGQAAASACRMIVIEEAHRLDAACLKLITQYAALSDPGICLLLMVEDEELPSAWAQLKACLTVEVYAAPTPHEAVQWAQRHLAASNKRATSSVVHQIVQAGGTDTAGLHTLLDQLIAWTGSREDITEDDLREFVTPSRAHEHFALANALGRRDVTAALEALDEELMRGREPLEMLGMLGWQLQRWLTVARAREAGLSSAHVATRSGIPSAQVDRILRQLRGRSAESLHQALEACWKLDCSAKRGAAALVRMELEHLIVQVCHAEAASAGASFTRAA